VETHAIKTTYNFMHIFAVLRVAFNFRLFVLTVWQLIGFLAQGEEFFLLRYMFQNTLIHIHTSAASLAIKLVELAIF